MNRQECDILNALHTEPYINQRILAECTGHSLGIVNRSIKNLKEEGYLDEQARLTEKAVHEIKDKAPRNAIILADGFGMRMGSADKETPKGLLAVKGELLIERTIRQLHEAGIQDIYIVVGFMKEQYEYLMDEYGVELIVNSDYASKGTIYSLFLALTHLSNTYVIPCNTWCSGNPYRRYELYSWYMVSDLTDKRSMIRVNRKMELISVSGQADGNGVIGISYLLEEQAAVARRRIAELCMEERHEGVGVQGAEKFWETALYGKDRMIVWARVAYARDAVQVDTFEQLCRVNGISDRLRSNVLAVSSRFLGNLPDKIEDMSVFGKGMPRHIFCISSKRKKYLMCIPGGGIDWLDNCGREAQETQMAQKKQVYLSISGKGICDEPVFTDLRSGYRIMDFANGVRTCDPMDVRKLEKCMALLRNFHGMQLTVEHEVDMFGWIVLCESLWKGKPSLYKDYAKTREDVFSLKPFIDTLRTRKSLTHMDAVPGNFLFFDKGKAEDLRLTGWEYAGMQDPHVDIAMFCVDALYNREWVDRLISIYFEGNCPNETRIKIYCYIAVCGLLRSNWCEYQMKQGAEFGEYSLRQYRYAKDYCRMVKTELKG